MFFFLKMEKKIIKQKVFGNAKILCNDVHKIITIAKEKKTLEILMIYFSSISQFSRAEVI